LAINRWNCSLVYWAAIGMMQQRVRFAPSPDRHHQGVSDELGRHRSVHRSADHTAGEEIDGRGNKEPSPPLLTHT